MSSPQAVGGAAGSPKDDGNVKMPPRHRKHLGRVVHYLIICYKREIPGHELHDRPETRHRCPDSDSSKTRLGDRGIDDPLRSELCQEALADLVGAVILRYLFTHEK